MRLYLAQYGPSAPTRVVIAPEKETEKVAPEEEVKYGETIEAGATVIKEPETPVEVKTVPVVSQEHTTPFKMVTELEGRLTSTDRVAAVTIFLQGKAVEEAGNLEKLLDDFKSKKGISQVELSIKLWMPQTMTKDELMKLLGKLPIPSEGTIKATLEVEKHESE
ncbi:hypothetical protein ES703_32650 [subsurface metagenome]